VSDQKEGFDYILKVIDELFEQVFWNNLLSFPAQIRPETRFFAQIQSELKMEEDMGCADVATIKDLGGNKYGEMRTFTGSPIDWLVKSWLGRTR